MDKLHKENIKTKRLASLATRATIKNHPESLTQTKYTSSKKKRVPHKSIIIEYSTPQKPIIIIWD